MAWPAVTLLLLPFLFWVLQRSLTLDFWYDEIFTLDRFIFVPLRQTVTDYSHPNNHIFFNLLSNLYVRCVGLHDTFAAMDTSWVLRLPPLLCAAGTLAFTFQAARRCGGLWSAYLSAVVLATTVPFFNFAAQVRGYSLSMFLLSAMVYFLFRWEETGRAWWAVAVSAAGTLALYTIPSNVYFLLSVGAIYAVAGLVRAARSATPSGPVRRLANRDLVAALLIAAAAAGAVLLYLPVLDKVVSNDYVQTGRPFDAATLTVLMPRMFLYLLSGRYLLLVPLAGAAAICLARRRTVDRILQRRFLFCLGGLVLPFVWSSLRGDRPPDRVFVNIAPVCALLVATAVQISAGILPARRNLAFGGSILALAYCYVMFAVSLGGIDRHLLADIEHGRKSQDSFYAYYQAYYAPLQVAEVLAERFRAAPGPVHVYEYGDQVALYRYLQKARVPCFTINSLQEIQFGPGGLAYVVTAWPDRCRRQIAGAFPSLICEIITPSPAFHGILQCLESVGYGTGQ